MRTYNDLDLSFIQKMISLIDKIQKINLQKEKSFFKKERYILNSKDSSLFKEILEEINKNQTSWTEDINNLFFLISQLRDELNETKLILDSQKKINETLNKQLELSREDFNNIYNMYNIEKEKNLKINSIEQELKEKDLNNTISTLSISKNN